MNLRVGIYLRVSTEEQSTDLQRLELSEYAKNRGWSRITYFEDKATGTNANRAMLQKLLEGVRQRQIDIVLIWKLDRLFRSLKDLVNTLHFFSEHGVSFLSLKDNVDMASSTGRLLVHLLGAFAQFERDLIAERVRAGLKNARAKGKKLGRPKIRDDIKIIELRNKGYSLRRIARELKTSLGAIHRCLGASKSSAVDKEKPE